MNSLQQFRLRVRVAVPHRVIVRVAEAEIGGEINDDIRFVEKLVNLAHRHAVRRAEEEHIHRFQRVHRREGQVGTPAQVRVHACGRISPPAARSSPAESAHSDAQAGAGPARPPHIPTHRQYSPLPVPSLHLTRSVSDETITSVAPSVVPRGRCSPRCARSRQIPPACNTKCPPRTPAASSDTPRQPLHPRHCPRTPARRRSDRNRSLRMRRRAARPRSEPDERRHRDSLPPGVPRYNAAQPPRPRVRAGVHALACACPAVAKRSRAHASVSRAVASAAVASSCARACASPCAVPG